ncbi:NO-inducible flavohemoprotein [Polaromonas sp. JS666]|uniref:NO-inducible flavohemoprotein n=1 Tax=Polaromonas sp. (strain JS666 / ATCC BAA-500) TaxID=296591 RepID=UPI0000464AC1|nr:NO-inducible flavohemoprotein [Polaromonas sp. JS666]ABE45317.1 globin [Polaromonas sp. JS666]
MLTAQQRAIVKSTVPLLESGGEALTTHFYQILLTEHPEVRPFFNQAHQANGDQPRALANGVLMYARHIDKLEQLGGLVAQIINKHVSLQIEPAHYPIVGACLLRAIREVLGAEIATGEVLAAWGAAYGQLADILIGAEEKIYAETAAAPGGWRGARRFIVARKVAESAEITSFYLQPEDGAALAAFQPGQYLGLKLVINGEEIRRNYSLSAAPNGRDYRISVKREPGGVASCYLHDELQEGGGLDVFPPAGEFVLADGDRPVVLISGGVGITPTLAMLDAALERQRPVHFIHFARNKSVHAFRDALATRQARHAQLRHFYVYDEHAGEADAPHATGLVDSGQLAQWLPASRDVDAYFLGPKPFMRRVRQQLRELGVPESQTRYEFFGPASALD